MSSTDSERHVSRRWVALLLLMATFLAGMVAGGAVDRLILFKQRRVLPRHGMRFVSEHVLRRLDRELDLTEQQKRQVKEILERREHSVERLWTGMQPLVRQEIDRANLEIERVLTPEQRPRYRKLVDRWRARARGFISPPNSE